jgi:hypothetical protein
MDLHAQVSLLREVVAQIRLWPFTRLSALASAPWTTEFGDPKSPLCQVEVELLDSSTVQGKTSLHLPVMSYCTDRTLGTDVFVCDDGDFEWNGKIYEYVDGVPHELHI